MTGKTVADLSHRDCTGCAACTANCPVDAIEMVQDKEGFYVPLVDSCTCIDCGSCIRKCPALEVPRLHKTVKRLIGQCGLNEALLKSSSGGLFIALSTAWINAGGAVVGCKLGADMLPVMAVERTVSGLQSMQGSKYPQAQFPKDVFFEVRELLAGGTPVAVFGTPCQLAGVRAFLPHDSDGLLLIDIICHGVGSPGLFRLYLDYLEKAFTGPARAIGFRDKTFAAFPDNYALRVEGCKGTYIRKAGRDPWLNAFSQSWILRESCYSCPFSRGSRIGDITIGDHFLAEGLPDSLVVDEGISLVLVNTQRGNQALELLEGSFVSCPIGEVKKRNLEQPTSRPDERDRLAAVVLQSCTERDLKRILRRGIADYARSLVPRSIKAKVKGLLGSIRKGKS